VVDCRSSAMRLPKRDTPTDSEEVGAVPCACPKRVPARDTPTDL
jgi:hypothetical protein